MKHDRWKYVGAFFALVLITVLWRWLAGGTGTDRPVGSTTDADHIRSEVADAEKRNRLIEKALDDFREGVKNDLHWQWKRHIDFYGEVRDFQNHPIAEAQVQFGWTDLSFSGSSKTKTATDQLGRFALKGRRGKILSVSVSKVGYYPMSIKTNHYAFEYADPLHPWFHIPDPKRPVVFRLRRIGETAALIHKEVSVEVPIDGTPLYIDLTSGKTMASGELEIRSWKPWPPQPMEPRYNWKCSLRLVSGGLREHTDLYPFEAPTNNFEAEVLLEMKSGDERWSTDAERSYFFMRTDPQQYGRLHMRTYSTTRMVWLDYYINPSGSRNLEYDARKEIRTEPP